LNKISNMRFVADLHIHSKYARAVSPKMTLPELDRWADDKGIQVMGTGDFTHPLWYEQMVHQLEPAEPGLYTVKQEHKLPTIKGTRANTRFLLTSEISSIYTRAGKCRRVHTLLFAPDLDSVRKINEALLARGCNIKSDGRPILGLDVQEICKIVWGINPEIAVVPAHIWTPWFALFGSKSGFNAIEECFGDFSKRIFAMETGLSSDPAMNWRLSALDRIALISNSDSHSLERIGREANIFNTELSYDGIMGALKENTGKRFVATIEYFPEEGMYHFDGHRKCRVSYDPLATRKHRGICESCGKPVTVGVLNRLDKLADRTEEEVKKEIAAFKIGEVYGQQYHDRPAFIHMVTLDSIIGEGLDCGVKTKGVKAEYDTLIRQFGSELRLLMEVSFDEIRASVKPQVAEGIRRMRAGEFKITPGYDGEYGEVHIFDVKEKKKIRNGGAKMLFDL
jgi:DNA helicase II / ATP-dependent DNA helicase PcrA